MPARLNICLQARGNTGNSQRSVASKTKSVIHPCIFKKMSVCIQSDCPMEVAAIHKAMESIGATIKEDANDADIVISQTRWSPSSPPRASTGPSGSRMVLELVQQKKEVKNVLISQIPWIDKFMTDKASSTDEKPKPPQKKLVVADARAILAPKSCSFTEMPTLCFTKVPRGCFACPFDKITTQKIQVVYQDRPKYTEHPPNHGYCEICNMHYNKAAEHVRSREHTIHAQECSWKEFDILARRLPRL